MAISNASMRSIQTYAKNNPQKLARGLADLNAGKVSAQDLAQEIGIKPIDVLDLASRGIENLATDEKIQGFVASLQRPSFQATEGGIAPGATLQVKGHFPDSLVGADRDQRAGDHKSGPYRRKVQQALTNARDHLSGLDSRVPERTTVARGDIEDPFLLAAADLLLHSGRAANRGSIPKAGLHLALDKASDFVDKNMTGEAFRRHSGAFESPDAIDASEVGRLPTLIQRLLISAGAIPNHWSPDDT